MIAIQSLEEVINKNPHFLEQFIGIYNNALYVTCMEAGGKWELEPNNSVDKERVINEAVDSFIDASFFDDLTGDSARFILNPTDGDRKAVSNFINRKLVEYYFEYQLLNQ